MLQARRAYWFKDKAPTGQSSDRTITDTRFVFKKLMFVHMLYERWKIIRKKNNKVIISLVSFRESHFSFSFHLSNYFIVIASGFRHSLVMKITYNCCFLSLLYYYMQIFFIKTGNLFP